MIPCTYLSSSTCVHHHLDIIREATLTVLASDCVIATAIIHCSLSCALHPTTPQLSHLAADQQLALSTLINRISSIGLVSGSSRACRAISSFNFMPRLRPQHQRQQRRRCHTSLSNISDASLRFELVKKHDMGTLLVSTNAPVAQAPSSNAVSEGMQGGVCSLIAPRICRQLFKPPYRCVLVLLHFDDIN